MPGRSDEHWHWPLFLTPPAKHKKSYYSVLLAVIQIFYFAHYPHYNPEWPFYLTIAAYVPLYFLVAHATFGCIYRWKYYQWQHRERKAARADSNTDGRKKITIQAPKPTARFFPQVINSFRRANPSHTTTSSMVLWDAEDMENASKTSSELAARRIIVRGAYVVGNVDRWRQAGFSESGV